jgi:autotransporter translocation and assembly factor TamB
MGVRRGYVDLLDRRFVIREGEIRFVGTSPPTPEINLTAAAEGNGITAIVRLSGAATDPIVAIDSEPTLPTDEILARLLFGRDVSRITPVQGIRLAAAVRQLEGGGGLDVLTNLRETIGIDTLDIGGDSPAEAYVSAGKYVAENVFVEVQQSLATGQTKARVEVELTDQINVVTETGDGMSGVEVEWRYDY